MIGDYLFQKLSQVIIGKINVHGCLTVMQVKHQSMPIKIKLATLFETFHQTLCNSGFGHQRRLETHVTVILVVFSAIGEISR